MPKFIDYHKEMPEFPPEAVKATTERIQSGRQDEFGGTIINVLRGSEGQGFCLSHAPNAEAVRKGHEAAGAPMPDDVIEVESLV